ncbi:glycosyltransferase [Skermania piniformis]|uniref:4,4'-diaponeurosporenoate glycosyltransferase n=1 Tax=Skermania pinensis TaxID=39122 RepID=A0ABX8SB76_9ACTN|nr:glycosyltransferase [Skermania piniformis]QXQ14254.1 glycosyltransferase [Skermania piniformis]
MMQEVAEVSRPTVSVITITFHDDEGLARTIESVLMQSGNFDLEHIIVDGAGSPETIAIMRRLGSTACLISEPDRGRYDAMNKGIRAARGDVLWFMNSGDSFAAPQAVQSALDTMVDVRNEWGFGLQCNFVADGSIRGVSVQRFPFSLWALAVGALGAVVPHQATYFGADLVAEIGEYDLDLPIAADQLFIMQAAQIVEPRRCWQVVSHFGLTGIGSAMSLREYFAVMSEARKKAGVRLTPWQTLDDLIVGYISTKTRVEAMFRRTAEYLLTPLIRRAEQVGPYQDEKTATDPRSVGALVGI